MKIQLKSPYADKNYSIQFFDCTESEMENIKNFFCINCQKYPVFL